jgi:hypothetical protein
VARVQLLGDPPFDVVVVPAVDLCQHVAPPVPEPLLGRESSMLDLGLWSCSWQCPVRSPSDAAVAAKLGIGVANSVA